MDQANIFKDKTILITGGTGSIGSELVNQLLQYNPKTIRILSNSENELWQSQIKLKDKIEKLRFLLGDIRNFERIKRASQNVDYIFNASDVKHITLSEYNPMEAVNVNLHGLENLIEAALINNVSKLIHLSTDKAINPTTVMGATKMLSERLCISREMAKGDFQTTISCVRFGNVLGSRGSVIPLVKEQMRTGELVTLTDAKMKRFIIFAPKCVDLILKATKLAQGGEIFVMKMPTVMIKDLIDVYIEDYCKFVGRNSKDIEIKIIGRRLGEKIDEKLISTVELPYCYETEEMFIIYPARYLEEDHLRKKIINEGTKIKVNEFSEYSTENQIILSKEEIRFLFNKFNMIK